MIERREIPRHNVNRTGTIAFVGGAVKAVGFGIFLHLELPWTSRAPFQFRTRLPCCWLTVASANTATLFGEDQLAWA